MREGFRERERNLGLNHTMTECKYLPRAKCQTSMNVSKLIFFFWWVLRSLNMWLLYIWMEVGRIKHTSLIIQMKELGVSSINLIDGMN